MRFFASAWACSLTIKSLLAGKTSSTELFGTVTLSGLKVKLNFRQVHNQLRNNQYWEVEQSALPAVLADMEGSSKMTVHTVFDPTAVLSHTSLVRMSPIQ